MSLSEGKLGMALETWIDDADTVLVSIDRVGDCNCILLCTFKSNLQSFKAAMGEP